MARGCCWSAERAEESGIPNPRFPGSCELACLAARGLPRGRRGWNNGTEHAGPMGAWQTRATGQKGRPPGSPPALQC